jgi:hypothetical protein
MKRHVLVAVLVAIHAYPAQAQKCAKLSTSTLSVANEFEALRTELTDLAVLPELASALDKARPAGATVTAETMAETLRRLTTAAHGQRAKESDAAKQKKYDVAIAILERHISAALARVLSALKVHAGGTSKAVAIRLSNPPSTRLRLSLDGEASGRHLEMEWDPAVTTPLVQHVDLGPDVWAVSASVEPIFMQQGDGSVVIATQFSMLEGTNDVFSMVGTPSALVASSRFSPDAPHQVTMTAWPQPTLSFTCTDAAKQTMDTVAFAAQVGARRAEQRSNAAPEIVTQTLSLLAEIAVERARSGAMAVVKDRFVDPLCTDDTKVKLRDLRLGPSEELAFPRTCETLESLRLEDILSSGDALLRALRDDGRYTVAPALIKKLTADHASLERLVVAVFDIANRAIDRGTFDGLEAQLILDLVGKIDVLFDALPTVQIVIPDAMKALLTQTDSIRKVICAGSQVGDCVASLNKALRTPHQWFLWGRSLVLQLADDEVKAVVGSLASLVDAHPLVRNALCAPGNDTAACLVTKYGQIPKDGTWLKFILSDADFRKAMFAALQDDSALKKPIAVACRAKLAVAIVKKCANATCAATQIAHILDAPGDYFKRDDEFPSALCWNDAGAYLPAPTELAHIQRIVIDGLELLDPVRLTQGQDRAIAAIHLVLEIIARIQGTRDERIVMLGEIAIAIARGQYDTALATLLRLVGQVAAHDGKTLPRPLVKLAELSGAVASYTAVYRATKDDDPEAAREARKKSLESLIDAATNRKGRDRAWVLSLGSNVGAALTYSNVFDQDDARLAERHKLTPRRLALRVPMGLSLQWLPGAWWDTPATSWIGRAARCTFKPFGLHVGINFVDLGQFVHADDTRDVRWSSFIAPGAEAGILFGGPQHALALTAHGAFVPGVSDPAAPTRAQWQYGVSLGYHVPFFDLN